MMNQDKGHRATPKTNNLFIMNNSTIKIATLNIKGLNNLDKQLKTLTLLKSYKLDIILLQETNIFDIATQQFLKDQWTFDSIWTGRTAILAGNKEIKLQDIKKSQEDRIISTCFIFKKFSFHIVNIYASPNTLNRTAFFNSQAIKRKENMINIIAGDLNTNLNSDINRMN